LASCLRFKINKEETTVVNFSVNGAAQKFDGDPNTPILWVLRDHLDVTQVKFGCGMALCGACTVHMNGQPIRSCSTPISAAAGAKLATIDGVDEKIGNALKTAWVGAEVPQCGYCQHGQMMSAAALIAGNKKPSDADIDAAMSGNVCRCGTYSRIKAAIKTAAAAA
jgi:isoquinoline 1-oxidoreductase subunit alpha